MSCVLIRYVSLIHAHSELPAPRPQDCGRLLESLHIASASGSGVDHQGFLPHSRVDLHHISCLPHALTPHVAY